MPRKRRYTTEQIITKLREADVLLSQGYCAYSHRNIRQEACKTTSDLNQTAI